jgi:hypothetical protein
MSNETGRDDDIAAATAAALLGGGTTVNAWSLMFGLVALLVSLSGSASWASACFAASVGAGLVQAYFALRCSIDAALFRRLGGERDRYERLDALLTAWGLTKSRPARPLQERIGAALALSRRQRILFYLQLATFAAGATIFLVSAG